MGRIQEDARFFLLAVAWYDQVWEGEKGKLVTPVNTHEQLANDKNQTLDYLS